jgi:hypothetical protein
MSAAVEIQVRADTSPAQASLNSFASDILGRLTPVIDVGNMVGAAFNAAASAVSAAVGFLKDAAAAAADAERTQRLLASAVGKHYEQLSQFNAALSEKLGIDDDDIAKAQTKLVALGVQRSKLEDATKATLGLAAATGQDLEAATKRVSSAFTENGNEARRLTELFQVAEAETQTFAGRTRALETAWGDFTETLGNAITQSEIVNGLLVAMRGSAADLTSFVSGPAGRELIDAFFQTIATGAANAIDAVAGMVRMFRDLKREYDILRNGFATEPIGPDALDTAQSIADRFRAVGAGQASAAVSAPRAAAALHGKTAQARAERGASSGASSMLSPEAVMGGQGRFSEFDAELAKRAAQEANAEQQMRINVRQNEIKAAEEKEAFYRKMHEAEREETARHYAELGKIGVQGVAGFLSGTIEAWASGKLSLAEAAGQAFFGMLSQIGQGLVGLGSAAVAAGLLGTVAPIFAPETGGPAGVAAGMGLMAAGGALIGLGALGRNAMAPTSSAGAPQPSSRMSASSVAPMGFGGQPATGPMTTVVNVTLGRGFVTGTPRDVGREIASMLRQADSLHPRFA